MGIKINNQSIAKLYLGNIAVVRAYSNGSIVYDSSVTPTPQPCFEVVDTITNASGNYVDVYATDTQKWYKRNNLNQYEEYGIMPIVYNLDTITYYTGKLVILSTSTDSHEYKYNGTTWVDLGKAGSFKRVTWIDPPSSSSTRYNIPFKYYFNNGYKMRVLLYTSNISWSGDTGGFLNYNNKSPIEFNFHSEGYYFDSHYPTSTSSPSVYSGDYSKRLMKVSAFNGNKNKKFIFELLMDKVVVTRVSDGAIMTNMGGGYTSSVSGWYSGLYEPIYTVSNQNPAHVAYIQIYNSSNVKVNDIRPVLVGDDIQLYDSVIDAYYANTSSNKVAYHFEDEGTLVPVEEYDTKVAPPDYVHYATLAELELMECPWYGMQATIGSDNIHFTYTQSGWEPDYLKFTVIDDNGSTFKFSNDLKYSIDGGSWVNLPADTASPLIPKDHNIRFRGNITPGGTGDTKCGIFTTSGRFNASGYIGTLLYGKSYSGQTNKFVSNALQAMFQSSKIVDASGLILPSVNNRHLYDGMFKGASQLVTPPISLNFTNAVSYGTNGMFMNCTSMTTVPSMTITSGSNATGAFQSMFQGCTSIVNADNIVLDLGTLPWDSMTTMFSGCTALQKTPIIKSNLAQSSARHAFLSCNQLTNITYLGTTTPSSTNSSDWLPSGCTATFYMNENATWDSTVTRDSNGVPSGCTITKIDPSSV